LIPPSLFVENIEVIILKRRETQMALICVYFTGGSLKDYGVDPQQTQGCSTLLIWMGRRVFAGRSERDLWTIFTNRRITVMSSSLLGFFATITDPRRPQGKMYGLAPILLLSVLAVLSGATSYRKIHGFIDSHLSRLNAVFGLGWQKAPAYSSVRTILHGLDAVAVEQAFRAHAATLMPAVSGDQTLAAIAVGAMRGFG
jgi:hypothetical protein